MNLETSNENDALLLHDLPSTERSAFSPLSTNPQTPTNPSRQFHYIPSISLLSFALALFLCAMLLLNLATFSSRQEFWNRFFLMSMTTRSKAELGSYWVIVCYYTLLRDCTFAEPTVDSSSFFSLSASRSFSSLAFLNLRAVTSRRMRSSSLELESQELMHLTSSFFSTTLSSLASSRDCRLASLSLISFCSLPIFSSKEQIKGTNSSTSISLPSPSPAALFFTSSMYSLRSASTAAISSWMAANSPPSLWMSCFCSWMSLQRKSYSFCIQVFSDCRQLSLHLRSSVRPRSYYSRTDIFYRWKCILIDQIYQEIHQCGIPKCS